MSLGLAAAGFDLIAHVEHDAEAAASYALNFSAPPGVPAEAWGKARDLEVDTADSLVRELGLKTSTAESFDVLARAFRVRRSPVSAARNWPR